jgi:hypothetical protein
MYMRAYMPACMRHRQKRELRSSQGNEVSNRFCTHSVVERLFGIWGKVSGDVPGCGSRGVVARLQPCMLSIPILVVRTGSGRDLVQYRSWAPCRQRCCVTACTGSRLQEQTATR